MISLRLPASFPTVEKEREVEKTDLENNGDLLSLLGIASL
jgi:hypothetical protein